MDRTTTRNPNVFEPPTAQQLDKHLASHPVVQGVNWQARLPIMLLIGGVLVLMLIGGPVFALLPLLALLGLAAYISSRTRAAMQLQQRVTRCWELAMIRRYRTALGQAWDLIPACQNNPELHGRVMTVVAHILNELGEVDAAEVAYRYLVDRLPPQHPLSLRLRVQRAIAALCSGRLADADDALRKLRGPTEQSKDPTLAGSYRMARLMQDVYTGHYADAVQNADQTAKDIQPLGIEAGYGHGLLALCFHRLAIRESVEQPEEREQLNQLANRWWDKATLLIPTTALIHRHPDLRDLARDAGDNAASPPDPIKH